MTDTDRHLLLTLRKFLARLGLTELPRHFLTFHLSTSGLDPLEDHILDLAACEIEDGALAFENGHLLDWHVVMTGGEYGRLLDRVQMTRQHFEMDRPEHYPYTPEILEASPHRTHPRKAFELLADVTAYAVEAKLPIFTVGGAMFDYEFLAGVRGFYLNYRLLGHDRLWDIGALEKAAQLGLFPHEQEHLFAFARRLDAEHVRGIRSSVTYLVEERYRLGDHPRGRDLKRVWDAAAGARAVAALVACWRHLLETNP